MRLRDAVVRWAVLEYLREHPGHADQKVHNPHKGGGAVPKGRKTFTDSDKSIGVLKYRGGQYAVVAKDARGKFRVEARGLTKEQAQAHAKELDEVRRPAGATEPPPARADTPGKSTKGSGIQPNPPPWEDRDHYMDAIGDLRSRGLDVRMSVDATVSDDLIAAVANGIGRAHANGWVGSEAQYVIGGTSISANRAEFHIPFGGSPPKIVIDPTKMMSGEAGELPSGSGHSLALLAFSAGNLAPPGAQRAAVIAAHEYGHFLDQRERRWLDRTMPGIMSSAENKHLDGILARHQSLTSNLTRYAGTNDLELVAESYALLCAFGDRLPSDTRGEALDATKHLGVW